jgi:hypothetical protein
MITCSGRSIVLATILGAVAYLAFLSSLALPPRPPSPTSNGAAATAPIVGGVVGSSGGNNKEGSFDHPPAPPSLVSIRTNDSSDSNKEKGNNNNNNSNTKKKKHEEKKKRTIGVASTVTGCGNDPFVDGAAVLRHSLDVHSTDRYDYHMYILHHPDAARCVQALSTLRGVTLLQRDTPINVSDIRSGGADGLKERIVKTGCCGEKELIKLEAYTLLDHPVVIHMDLDAIVLKPMDDVLDFMLDPVSYGDGRENERKRRDLPLMWPEKVIPDDVSLLFTKDYNVVSPRRADKPYQGGFFVIKPSLETYEHFRQIVLGGNYDVKKGWGGKVGPFYGGMTIQGLLPWYYEYVRPGRAVELNRCVYNNMSDNPKLVRNNGSERCRTDEDECEDCRYRPPDAIATFHYTICQKPWSCLRYQAERPDHALCREMVHLWFLYRSRLEASWGRGGGDGTYQPERYMGYCTKPGGYLPIEMPYGRRGGGAPDGGAAASPGV